MPDAPLRTRMRGEGRLAALPSLNPPERTDAKPEQGGKELRKLHRHLTVPAERAPDTSTKLSRFTYRLLMDSRFIDQPCLLSMYTALFNHKYFTFFNLITVRTSRKRGKEGPRVAHIHGSIQLE